MIGHIIDLRPMECRLNWHHVSFGLMVLMGLTPLISSCSSEDGKVYKVRTDEAISQADPNTVVDDGIRKELFESKDFKLTFEAPAEEEVSIGSDGLTVRVRPWNEPPTSTWSLYYTTAFKDLTTTRPIFEDLPISLTEVDWNTATVPSGTYYLFAEGRSGAKRSIYWLGTKVTVTIDEESAGPIVVISSALDGNIYGNGDTLTIAYNAVSTNGSSSKYDVFISPDGGQNWQALEAGTDAESFTITFDSEYQRSARYKIRVDADDGEFLGSAESVGLFGFSPNPVTYTGEIKAILEAKCATAGCHDETSARGENRFNAGSWEDRTNNVGTSTGVNTNQEAIIDRTRRENDMPPTDSPQLTQEERDLLALWAWGDYLKE